MRKKLIIVSGKDEMDCASYLQQLISAKDDEGDVQVGTKDGSVEAVVWNEKQYEDNRPKLNSTNYILFMGNSPLAKSMRANMKTRFDKLGMRFGWLGTQAFLYVEDGSLNGDNVDAFKALCSEYKKTFEKDLQLRYSPSSCEANPIGAKDVAAVAVPAAAFGLLGAIASVAAAAGTAAVGTANAIATHGKAAIDRGVDLAQQGEAKRQQYSLATLAMYMDGLPLFLGE